MLNKYHTMKTYGGVEVLLRAFLASALDGGEWSAPLPGRFIHGQRPRYPLNGRMGGPQSRSWLGRREKEIPAPAGNRSPVICPVA